MNDEPRWETMIPANDTNRFNPISQIIGFPVVGIVDDLRGGIVAYASEPVADEIVKRMNANRPMHRYEIRAHASVNAESEQEARELIDTYLGDTRDAGGKHNFIIALDEGSADIIEED